MVVNIIADLAEFKPRSFCVLQSEQRDNTPWTNFSEQDETWAEFSTLEVAVCMPCIYFVME